MSKRRDQPTHSQDREVDPKPEPGRWREITDTSHPDYGRKVYQHICPRCRDEGLVQCYWRDPVLGMAYDGVKACGCVVGEWYDEHWTSSKVFEKATKKALARRSEPMTKEEFEEWWRQRTKGRGVTTRPRHGTTIGQALAKAAPATEQNPF